MAQTTQNNGGAIPSSFLKGGGEMGQRIRAFDWASTPVGPIGSWPQSLLVSVNTILNSRFPMFIWWGKDLIQFYNDAYRPSLGNDGKHPSALGQRGEECWPEIWHVIYPLIRQVLDGGESTWSENQLIPIYRNGRLEDVYWTFSYSPIIDEGGEVGGVLVVCNENTDKVLNLFKLEESYKKIKESEDQLSFAIEAAELGTWDYNPLTDRFSSNNRLKSWFGFGPYDRIELSTAINAMIEKDRRRVVTAIQRALQYESGGFYDIEYTIVNVVTGQERVVRAKGRAWFNEERVAYRFNGILQDITGQEQFAEQLKQQVAERTLELQRSNEDLLQFAHVITHDLKEPVRKVKVFSNRIKDEMKEGLPPKVNLYLDKIQHASDRMFTMIEGVLNYSSLSADDETVDFIDLNEVIRSIQGDLEIMIQQKAAQIEYASLPTIQGAPILVYQLFYNLINNSLKFSKNGVDPVITISSSLVREEGRDFARVRVADNGIGFDQQYAGSIFNTFARLHSKDKFEGTGMGLALSKKIVERHGGTISALGEVGEGATFILTLPLLYEKRSI